MSNVHICEGKPHISLWCDGKIPESEASLSNEERENPPKEQRKRCDALREKEIMESIFLQLKEKHGNTYSGPQLRLWARTLVAKTHIDMDDPPRVPMITGTVHKKTT